LQHLSVPERPIRKGHIFGDRRMRIDQRRSVKK
jgi:hypothetical protein